MFTEQVKVERKDSGEELLKTGKGAGGSAPKGMDGGVAVPLSGNLCFASDQKLDYYCAHSATRVPAYVCTTAVFLSAGKWKCR